MSEREVMEYDVVVVGAGPAGLACSIRLKQLKPDLNVCVIEKASQVGAHILSGAVIEPQPLDELLPGWRDNPPPVCVPAKSDRFRFLTRNGSFWFPTPPQMHNKDNFIVSLGALCAWMEPFAENAGVDVFPGFAAAEALVENDCVTGVRIGDMGVDMNGNEKPTYTQGIDIRAPTTVLAEGCRGSVSKQLIARFKLDADCDPQTYGIGFKELWQVTEGKSQPGLIQHTLGWPLDKRTYGGSFIYHLEDNQVAVGFVAGLDYEDPGFEPFEAFQQFKHHPAVKALFEGGTLLSAGTRALVEGGWQSMPKMDMPGAMLIGDCGGTLNVPKIKGTHTAMRSGMIAAEHLAETNGVDGFDAKLRASAVGTELKKVRNIRPGFHGGLWAGLINAGWETLSLGFSPWTLKNHNDAATLKPAGTVKHDYLDRDLAPKDRLASVYFAGNAHEEDQPVHLQVADTDICVTKCKEEYDNPCTRFCPAGVYEMLEEGGTLKLQINASNCVHCKTCDIKDPYEIITWVTPEGGSGPNYQNL